MPRLSLPAGCVSVEAPGATLSSAATDGAAAGRLRPALRERAVVPLAALSVVGAFFMRLFGRFSPSGVPSALVDRFFKVSIRSYC
jgi:hypothetical protein